MVYWCIDPISILMMRWRKSTNKNVGTQRGSLHLRSSLYTGDIWYVRLSSLQAAFPSRLHPYLLLVLEKNKWHTLSSSKGIMQQYREKYNFIFNITMVYFFYSINVTLEMEKIFLLYINLYIQISVLLLDSRVFKMIYYNSCSLLTFDASAWRIECSEISLSVSTYLCRLHLIYYNNMDQKDSVALVINLMHEYIW